MFHLIFSLVRSPIQFLSDSSIERVVVKTDSLHIEISFSYLQFDILRENFTSTVERDKELTIAALYRKFHFTVVSHHKRADAEAMRSDGSDDEI